MGRLQPNIDFKLEFLQEETYHRKNRINSTVHESQIFISHNYSILLYNAGNLNSIVFIDTYI